VLEHCITEARSHDLNIDTSSARGDVADKGFCVTLTDLPVPSPLIPLGHQNVAPEILQDLVDLDRFPKHLPVHVQLPHRTRRRTEKVAAVPRQGNVREDGGTFLVVRLSVGTPGEVEGFIDVRDVTGEETADDGRQ
jgi:hypothetical protein